MKSFGKVGIIQYSVMWPVPRLKHISFNTFKQNWGHYQRLYIYFGVPKFLNRYSDVFTVVDVWGTAK